MILYTYEMHTLMGSKSKKMVINKIQIFEKMMQKIPTGHSKLIRREN